MITTVTKKFRFEAAHRLKHLPDTHKCSRPHGHSYVFTVEITGRIDPEMGWFVDYAEIGRVVNPIVEKLDHRDLNKMFSWITTAENLAVWIYDAIKVDLPITRIVLKETASTSVIYPAS